MPLDRKYVNFRTTICAIAAISKNRVMGICSIEDNMQGCGSTSNTDHYKDYHNSLYMNDPLTHNHNKIAVFTLPFMIDKDLAQFKLTTLHKPVIMGRHTYMSLPKRHFIKDTNLHYLQDRYNIVLTSNPKSLNANLNVETSTYKLIFTDSVTKALTYAHNYIAAKRLDQDYKDINPDNEIFIIGGAKTLKATAQLLNKLYLTVVDTTIPLYSYSNPLYSTILFPYDYIPYEDNTQFKKTSELKYVGYDRISKTHINFTKYEFSRL